MKMPKGNHYGPYGYGPMSGHGMGFCGGYEMPGYAATGCRPMRRGHRFGGWGRDMYYAAFEMPYPEDNPEEKLDMLRTRQTWLEGQLNEVQQEISELETKTRKAA
jgi:hypothetical protein